MDKKKVLDIARERCTEYRKVTFPPYRFSDKHIIRFAKLMENEGLERACLMLEARGEMYLAELVLRLKNRGRSY